ncbi:hypothetical protein SFMTTN_2031 [Sulfuriferula multivorans]|uniref:Uncharacterized protein n=1 Tax=Sulfuriferula multivorans TaxID=1559896 RepID=A0A401JF38_9PROT|nr:hypothetical protein [Sulfuriferula multivorans]GBL46218.1 hypothetical protein SFMTTN_2031 [Sulfuriferula multivorans]
MTEFRPKHPSEAFALEFDFSRLTTSIDSATIAITVVAGVDASPAAVLDGAAQIVGAVVYQRIRAGVDMTNYFFEANGVSGLDKWSIEALLPVRVKR